eukprot:1906710-Pyramimonas_sp.AAC.1
MLLADGIRVAKPRLRLPLRVPGQRAARVPTHVLQAPLGRPWPLDRPIVPWRGGSVPQRDGVVQLAATS